MNKILTFLLCIFCISTFAQTTADFENIALTENTFLNGSDYSGGFESGNVYLPNNYFYNSTYNYSFWDGFMISNTTDTTTASFTNESSCIAGAGNNNSSNFAVAFLPGGNQKIVNLNNTAIGKVVNGVYINNSTYAYLSMKNGDGFASKFGGITGNEEDYFFITIKSYFEGNLSNDSVNFYLADFRFEDNTQDYIVKDWTYVDLTNLGNVDSLAFTLTSTDVGNYGINTPTYFCIDDLETSDITLNNQQFINSDKIKCINLKNEILIQSEIENATVLITDINGKTIKNLLLNFGDNIINNFENKHQIVVVSVVQNNKIIFSQKAFLR